MVLTPLNLCAQTLDGIRNHSWSRPTPSSVEGEIVSWADRIAYCAHDLEDAIGAGIVTASDVPPLVAEVCGATRREQLRTFVREVIATTARTGSIGMGSSVAGALAELRAFNYERIYTRPESLAQSAAVVAVLQALVSHYLDHPDQLPGEVADGDPVHAAVAYVGGMTDRFAFDTAVQLLGWNPERLPRQQ